MLDGIDATGFENLEDRDTMEGLSEALELLDGSDGEGGLDGLFEVGGSDGWEGEGGYDGFAGALGEDLYGEGSDGEDEELLFGDDFDGLDGLDDVGESFDGYDGYDDFDGLDGYDPFDGEGAFEGSDGYSGSGLVPGDAEVEQFIGGFLKKIGRVVKKGVRWVGKRLGPLVKVLAPMAAKILGGVVGGPAGSAIASTLTSAILKETEGESEAEATSDVLEAEAHFESVGGDREAYELMELFAEQAATADGESEADHAVARMALMTRALVRRDPRLRAVYPRVMRASAALAKTFASHPQTRGAVRLVPLITRNTLVQLSRHKGRITPRLVVTVMSQQSAKVLATRNRIGTNLRRHRRAVVRARSRGPVRRPRPRPRARRRRTRPTREFF